MSSSLNKVVIIGNLGRDPEIRTTNDGREIASFSLATTESWKDKETGEKKEKTEWHRVVCFQEGLVKVIKQFAKKGSKLYIEGQLATRKWVDKESNQEKYSTEIVMQGFNTKMLMLDSKAEASNLQQGGASNAPAFDNSDLDDEIPF
jgi:single-strand DNA-binding protein